MSYPLKEKLENAKPVVRGKQVNLRYNEAEFAYIADLADKNHKTVGEFVREVSINHGEDEHNFRILAESIESLILIFDKKLSDILNILKNK